MPMYTVEQGDCLASIAKEHGFADWRTIYNHAQNAEFRRKRPNPNIIYPGDELFIPEKQVKEEDRATGSKHDFTLKAKPTKVRIRLRNEEGQAFASKKYKLVIGDQTHEGSTAGDGLIEKEIPANARSGQLTVWLDDDTTRPGFTWNLKIGHLDPVDTNTGVQARLKNLGFDCGPIDGIVGPRTRAAIMGFQMKSGLNPTGELDAATRDKLGEKHDEA